MHLWKPCRIFGSCVNFFVGNGWITRVALESLAARLKAFREGKGLTKYRLAKLCGISETYLYRLELGEIKNPRRDTLQALASGLGITLAQLIGETSPWQTWELVEQSLKAYVPVYGEIEGTMAPIDYIVTTRTETPPTLRAYRIEGLYLEPEVLPGDTIIVDTGLIPSDGDLVVAILAGQPVIRRYSWAGQQDLEGASIHGVITDLQRKLRR